MSDVINIMPAAFTSLDIYRYPVVKTHFKVSCQILNIRVTDKEREQEQLTINQFFFFF